MKNFPKKLKVLQFSGLGEPLLNKDIAQMVELSKSIAEKVVLYSNGSLLSPKNSTLLINSGLDTIRISMQGVSCEDYKKVSDVDIVFDELISNIRSLYEHKGSCEVFIKMPDIILKDEKKRESFREIFENICDAMSVESISPLFSDVDYSTIKDKYDSSIYEQALSEPIQICPQPFYTMYLMANGNIMPCCISEMDNYLIGNITEDNIFDVWNGHRLKEFRLKQAKGLRSIFPACKKCNFIKYGICESDNIDSIGDNLIQIYK
jgi:radical SAM protein with 4Fe4S-binding SPASM domain